MKNPTNTNKAFLIILDGWGNSPDPKVSAIDQANTPCVDQLIADNPHAELITYGEEVGLPGGQMGNSEVGHLNIGAGRIVYQELLRINNAIKDCSFQSHPVLIEAMQKAKNESRKLHFMGLVSDGGVHAQIEHLKTLCEMAIEADVPNTFIHAIMDGRDTSPHGGQGYIEDVQNTIQGTNINIASIIGRYYAMDRDKRWERIQLAYDLLTQRKGTSFTNPVDVLKESYRNDVTDEFIQPHFNKDHNGTIEAGDVVIFFNYRTDRPRQITQVLTQDPIEGMTPLDLHFVTMTNYNESFKGLLVVYEKDNLENTIGQVISEAGLTQVRIAETEKYAHVTHFFSGGREALFQGEKRLLVPSPKVATYDLQPEMSADGISDKIIAEIEANQPDFICLNFANTDMVGHTGDFKAAIKAAETVDHNVRRLMACAQKFGYESILIADHGNSDTMINPDGSPHTAHTTNPVSCIYVSKHKNRTIKDGKLGDIAPTILDLMGVDIPSDMTGDILIQTK